MERDAFFLERERERVDEFLVWKYILTPCHFTEMISVRIFFSSFVGHLSSLLVVMFILNILNFLNIYVLY